MRFEDWPARLSQVVAHHRDFAGEWGVSDCWMLAVDAHEAITGEMLAPDLRGYDSEKSGYRLFARHGFSTVGEALAAHLPDVAVLMAGRGDLGVIERPGGNGEMVESCGVVTGTGLAVKTLYDDGTAALEYHPVTAMTRAFKVA